METDRFSRHLNANKPTPRPHRLVPDANFSRNVAFHVVRDHDGKDVWIGRYMTDLLEYAAICHENGLLVELDGEEYLVTVAPARKVNPHG
jgi:hypothetical protein